jgi:hypothetical protein
VPELTPQTEGGRYAPCLPPLPPTHSGSGGRQGLARSPSFAVCRRGCSRAQAPAQDNRRRQASASYLFLQGAPGGPASILLRCAIEVGKLRQCSSCRVVTVALSCSDGHLEFSVADDGLTARES